MGQWMFSKAVRRQGSKNGGTRAVPFWNRFVFRNDASAPLHDGCSGQPAPTVGQTCRRIQHVFGSRPSYHLLDVLWMRVHVWTILSQQKESQPRTIANLKTPETKFMKSYPSSLSQDSCY